MKILTCIAVFCSSFLLAYGIGLVVIQAVIKAQATHFNPDTISKTYPSPKTFISNNFALINDAPVCFDGRAMFMAENSVVQIYCDPTYHANDIGPASIYVNGNSKDTRRVMFNGIDFLSIDSTGDEVRNAHLHGEELWP